MEQMRVVMGIHEDEFDQSIEALLVFGERDLAKMEKTIREAIVVMRRISNIQRGLPPTTRRFVEQMVVSLEEMRDLPYFAHSFLLAQEDQKRADEEAAREAEPIEI